MEHNDYLKEPKVAAWIQSMRDAGCTISEITPLNLLYRSNGELLFALLKVTAIDAEGHALVPYIFIRGHACIVVPLLRNRTTGEERFLMVEQRRIGHGCMALEFPAGMLDRDIHNPADVAVRELHEETGLDIPVDHLVALTNHPMHSSPGASDEGIYYYACIVSMEDTRFRSFEGAMRGCDCENELIRVTLKTREDAERNQHSLQAQLAFFLFDRARHLLEKKAYTI